MRVCVCVWLCKSCTVRHGTNSITHISLLTYTVTTLYCYRYKVSRCSSGFTMQYNNVQSISHNSALLFVCCCIVLYCIVLYCFGTTKLQNSKLKTAEKLNKNKNKTFQKKKKEYYGLTKNHFIVWLLVSIMVFLSY